MSRSLQTSLVLPSLALIIGIGGVLYWLVDRDSTDALVVQNTSAATPLPESVGSTTTWAPVTTAPSEQPSTSPVTTADDSVSPQRVAVEVVELRQELVGMSASAAVEVLTPIASKSVIDGVVADLGELQAAAPAGLRLRVGVLATNTRSVDANQAVVDLWVVQVATSSGVVRSSWSTVTVELHLDNDGWRVMQVSSRSGPTPGLVGEATSTAEFEQRLTGFTDDELVTGT